MPNPARPLPPGYLRFRDAASLVRARMFRHEIPEAVRSAAIQNIEDAKRMGTDLRLKPLREVPTRPSAIPPLIQALEKGDLNLFMLGDNQSIIKVDRGVSAEVLSRTDFPTSLSTVYRRFLSMVPIMVL